MFSSLAMLRHTWFRATFSFDGREHEQILLKWHLDFKVKCPSKIKTMFMGWKLRYRKSSIRSRPLIQVYPIRGRTIWPYTTQYNFKV